MSGSGMPAPGTQDGNWVWDGSEWVCNPDCGYGGGVPAPCPPFGPPVFSGPVNQPPWYPGANGGVSFGSVAPANPVRGHMWWDGTTFWLFDGAAWVAVGHSGGAAAGGTHTFVQPAAPTSANTGDIWWSGVEFYVWDGLAWNGVGPAQPMGVTDGSSAAAGRVGEFLTTTAAVPFAASPTITNTVASTLVVPPGDWNLWASAEYTTAIGFLGFSLSAPPTGVSGDIRGQVGTSGPTVSYSGVMGSMVRGSFTAASLLSFNVHVDQTTAGLLAGTVSLTVCARRMR
jgi:hypothetical protein